MSTVLVVILVVVVVAIGLAVAWRWFVPPLPPRMMDAFTDADDPHTPDRGVMLQNLDAQQRYEKRDREWEERQLKRLRRRWDRAPITWTQLDESRFRADVRGAGVFLLSWDPDDVFDDKRWELRAEHQRFARLAWWDTQPTLAETETKIRHHLTESGEAPSRERRP